MTHALLPEIDAFTWANTDTLPDLLAHSMHRLLCVRGLLAEAQRLGFAEADPAFDIEGVDAAHKLAILAAIGFGTQVDFKGVRVSGITQVRAADIDMVQYGSDDTKTHRKIKHILGSKYRDRVGRLLDTQPYRFLRFPRARFSPALLQELLDGCSRSVSEDGDDLAARYNVSIGTVGVDLGSQFTKYGELRVGLMAGRGEAELDSMQFLKLVREKLAVLHLKDELLHRGVNEGFSGGEKKRNEIFQLAVLEPKLAILDETDSGLDIDALKNVADGVNALRSPDRAFVVITHYQRLLDYIKPDVVHVLAGGRIVETGGPELALELEQHGYAWIKDRVAPEKVA